MVPDAKQEFQRQQRRLIIVLLFVLVTLVPLALLTDIHTLDFTLERFAVWCASLVVMLVTLTLKTPLVQDQWFSYTHLSVLITWLILGPTWALLAYGGALVADHLIQNYLLHASVNASTFKHSLLKLLVSVTALLSAATVYEITGGEFPFELTKDIPTSIMAGLLANMLIILMSRRFLSPIYASTGEILDTTTHLVLVHFVVLVVPNIYVQLGFFPYLLGLTMLALLAKRQQYMDRTRASLISHERDYQFISQFTHDISSTLELQDILDKLYVYVSQEVDVSAFYVATLNRDSGYVSYPKLLLDDRPVSWLSRPMWQDPLLVRISEKPVATQFIRKSFPRYFEHMPDLPVADRFGAVLVYPLMIGATLLGMIAIFCPPSHAKRANATLEIMSNQASLAIRNSMLYNRRSQLADNLSLMNRSVQDVMFSLSSDDAIRAACKMAQKIGATQKVAILLLDPESKSFLRLAHSEGLTPSHQHYLDTSMYGADQIPESFTTVADIDLLNERELMREVAISGGFRAFAEIPLRSGDLPVGVLVIFHDTPHHYEASELKLLEVLCYQLTAALDYTELLSALELYASEQAQLVHLTRITMSSLNLSQVLESIADLTRQMMNANYVYLALTRTRRTMNVYDGSILMLEGMSVEHIPEFNSLFEVENPIPRIFYPTDDNLSAGMVSFLRQYAESALTMVPLVVNQQAFGAILLGCDEDRQFNDSEWRLLEMATNQIATQLYNVLAYQETEAALGRRLQQLAYIEQIAEQISRSLDVDQLIKNVLEAAVYGTQAELAAIGLLNDNLQLEVVIRELQHGEWFDANTVIPVETGLTGLVVRRSEIRVIPDNLLDPNYHTLPEYRGSYRSSLLVPLIGDKSVIGVLNLESSQPNFFNNEREEFAKNLAGHTVISIQNARLYERIRQQRDQTRAILNSTHEGIIMLDREGRLIQANPGAELMLSLSLEQHQGDHFLELLSDHLDTNRSTRENGSMQDTLEEMMNILQDEPRRVTTRRYSIEINQFTKYIEEVGTPVLDSDGQVMGRLLTLRDITEERKLAEYRDEISNMVVHDLRGPLGAIISSITLTLEILSDIEDVSKTEAVNSLMNVSLDSASSLLDMVDSLLDIAKLENQRMPILYTPTSLRDLVNSAYSILQSSLEKAEITFEQVVPKGLPTVHVDPDKIRRVLINLLDNAGHYTPRGGKIQVSAEMIDTHKLIVRIADSGAGIPVSEANLIFDKFRQVQGSRPVNGSKGTGLGLTFCKLAVEAHGEKIWVEQNGPLPGACFAFTLTTL